MAANTNSSQDVGARALLIAASVVIVIAGLKSASDLLLPFLVAVFLAILCLPILGWFERLGLPRPLAVPAAGLVVLCVLGLVVLMLARSANQFADKAPEYQARLNELAQDALEYLDERGVDTEEMSDVFQVGSVMEYVRAAISSATSILSNMVLVALTLIFLLFEASALPPKIRAAFGSQIVEEGHFRSIVGEVQSYFGIKIFLSLITGVLIGGWVAACGLEFFMLWGFVAFLLNFVPNLGSIMAAVPAVLLALVDLGVPGALMVAVGYLIVNMVIGNLIEPRMMGQRLGLSTLVVFLSLIVWGWIWGPLGMLLSVPLTMLVKILLESTPDLQWAAILLSSEAPKDERSPA